MGSNRIEDSQRRKQKDKIKLVACMCLRSVFHQSHNSMTQFDPRSIHSASEARRILQQPRTSLFVCSETVNSPELLFSFRVLPPWPIPLASFSAQTGCMLLEYPLCSWYYCDAALFVRRFALLVSIVDVKNSNEEAESID